MTMGSASRGLFATRPPLATGSALNRTAPENDRLGARHVYGHSVSGRLLLPMRRTSALVNAEFVAPPTFAPSKCEPATRQTGSTLMATQLNRAILDGADLRGADLRSCQGLTAEQLQGAILDHRTRLPRELQYLLPTPPHTPCQKSSSCGRVATH